MWAKENGALMIVAGPVISANMERLGENRVAVPEKFYKVICRYAGDTPTAIGFVFENRNYSDESLLNFAVPVDEVETVTGIDFFPSFPDSIENRMESSVDWTSWSF